MVNWHRFAYLGLLAVGAVSSAILKGWIAVPPGLTDVAFIAGIASVATAAILPAIQANQGPAAPRG